MFTFIAPATPCSQLRMRVASFYELLKILLALLVKTLAYTSGTTSKHQRATWPELYPKSIVFLRIVAWHMKVFSHLPNVWGYGAGCCDVIKNAAKKHISTSNFETSSLPNVTAKKPICNMYFMYVDMAWFQSLLRLEHDMLHSTVSPMHKICPMSMCWRPYPTRTKECLFCLSFLECYPYNRNLWFLFKKIVPTFWPHNMIAYNLFKFIHELHAWWGYQLTKTVSKWRSTGNIWNLGYWISDSLLYWDIFYTHLSYEQV